MECRRRFDDRARQEAGLQLSDPIDRIPEDRRERARSALTTAFGRAPVTSLEPITMGASAAVAIMDFVPHRPMSDYLRAPPDLARDLGNLVARLQAIPAFPPVIDYPTLVGRLLGLLLASGRFTPGLLDGHREGFERIREAYPWYGEALVSSHNDLNPANILLDGERLWLVDWETAYRNDPLVDVATLTIFIAASPELEQELLRSWLGREPDRIQRARLALMRLLARLFFGCAATALLKHSMAMP